MACRALLPNFTLPPEFKAGELPPDSVPPGFVPPGCAGSFDPAHFDSVAAEVLCAENGTTVAPGFVGCGLDTAGRLTLAVCNVSACEEPVVYWPFYGHRGGFIGQTMVIARRATLSNTLNLV